MFPGMITGQSTATVLTTGAIAAPVLGACGIPRPKVAAIIAMSAIYGMIAPPISLPTMIMGSGVDMPFAGFDHAAGSSPRFRWPSASTCGLARGAISRRSTLEADANPSWARNYAAKHGVPASFFPLLLVAALLIAIRVAPAVVEPASASR